MRKNAIQRVVEPEDVSGDPSYRWRYPVPTGWRSARLGDVIEIVRGISFPKDAKAHEPRAGYVACLRTTNVQRDVEWDDLWFVPEEYVKRENQYVRPGDILISTANSYELVGKVAPVTNMPHQATLGAFISLLRPKEDVDSKFAYYQIAWSDTQDRIRSTASTTTNISNVSTKKLSNIELAFPPLDQQKRIVAEIEKQFSRLDEAVANLKRVKANLKRYKAAVLKAAVEGRLVETEAELARREGRSYETGAQLLQRILETRRSQWKGKGKYKEPAALDTTDLPELPEGWVWASVEQLGDVGTGATPLRSRRDYYEGGKIPWVTSGALNEEYVSAADEYITDLAVEETNAKVFPARTLLVAMYGEGKTRGKVSELLIDAATNQACAAIVMQGFSERVRDFTKLFFLKNYEDIRRLSSGGVQPNLNLSHIKATAIPFPSLDEQLRIVAEVERRLSLVREVESQVDANLKRAERLRQSVLGTAFSGRLFSSAHTNLKVAV
jgi:type I restriction enzyme S subunit